MYDCEQDGIENNMKYSSILEYIIQVCLVARNKIKKNKTSQKFSSYSARALPSPKTGKKMYLFSESVGFMIMSQRFQFCGSSRFHVAK